MRLDGRGGGVRNAQARRRGVILSFRKRSSQSVGQALSQPSCWCWSVGHARECVGHTRERVGHKTDVDFGGRDGIDLEGGGVDVA